MQDVQPQRVSGPPVYRLLVIVVMAVLLVAGGAVVFAGRSNGTNNSGSQPAADASQDPNASAAPDASAAPGSTQQPGKDGKGGGRGPGPGFGRGGFFGGFGGFGGFGRPGVPGSEGGFGGLLPDGSHAIKITAIDGNNLSLATEDGWKRTIDASTAKITRDGTAITVADLKTGDTIRLAETHNADGSYTITDISVVTPRLAGTVTAIGSDSITLSQPDGTSLTVHVSSTTMYKVPGVTSATLADVKVGNLALATGTLRDDGSLDATTLNVFNGQIRGPGRPPRGGPGAPGASPAPSTPPNG